MMAAQTILTKTAKGILETRDRAGRLTRELRAVLVAVDGKATVAQLLAKSGMIEQPFQQALGTLLADGYIKVVAPQGATAEPPGADTDLDFTAAQGPAAQPAPTAKPPAAPGEGTRPPTDLPSDVQARLRAEAAERTRLLAELRSGAPPPAAQQAQPAQAQPAAPATGAVNPAPAQADLAERVQQLNARVEAARQARNDAFRPPGTAPATDLAPQAPPAPAPPRLEKPAQPVQPVPAAAPGAPPKPETPDDLPVVDLSRAAVPLPVGTNHEVERTPLERAIGQVSTSATPPAGSPGAPPIAPASPPPPRPNTPAQPRSTPAAPASTGQAPPPSRPNIARPAQETGGLAEARRKAEANELSRRAAEAHQQKKEAEERRVATARRQQRRKRVLAGSTIVLAVALAGGAAWLQFFSLDGSIPAARLALSQRLNEPVTIASLRYVLLPTPRLVLEGVAIGKTEGVRVRRIEARALPFVLFREAKQFGLVEAQGVTLHASMLGTLPAWTSGGAASTLRVDRLRLLEVTLSLPGSALADIEGEVRFAPDGQMQQAVFNRASARLELTQETNGVQAHFEATTWRWPFGRGLEFDHVSVKGVLRAGRMSAGTFTTRAAGGYVEGTLKADLRGPINLEGEFKLDRTQIEDLARSLVPEFAAKGLLKASGRYTLRHGAGGTELQMQAAFQAARGELANLDLVRGMQAPGSAAFRGGRTGFDELAGTVELAAGRYAWRQVRLVSGPLNATATLDVSTTGELNGRMATELAPRGGPVTRQALTIGGTLKDPQLRR